nr:MAG TPA: FAM163 family [Caudoviricetes sp.]
MYTSFLLCIANLLCSYCKISFTISQVIFTFW